MSDGYQKELGKIQFAKFGTARGHSFFELLLLFDFGDSGQGFQMAFSSLTAIPKESQMALDAFKKILELFDVEDIKKTEGHYAYALRKPGDDNIIGIERTSPDGGKRFVRDVWRASWGYED